MGHEQRDTGAAVRLGLLIGCAEALAIVRWDWTMSDPTWGRATMAVAWALAILALSAFAWTGLEWACRYRRLLATVIWFAAVYGARAWVGDRFYAWSLALIPVGLLLAWRAPSRLEGLLALLIAAPALWARVPIVGAPLNDVLVVLGPPVAVCILLGAWSNRRAAILVVPCAVIGLTLATAWPTGRSPANGREKNVLFIVVDTLRRDHVEPYAASNHGSTPAFARLAAEGTLFDDAVTVIPKTTQSVAAFFTGRYPVSNGVRVLKGRLSSQELTLAEVLRERGWSTAAFVHNGWLMRGRGFEQGFEQFRSWFEMVQPYGPLRYTGVMTALDGLSVRRVTRFDANTDARITTDSAINWMERQAGRPFFAYLHYFDPHWPYRPPGEDGDCLVNNIRKSKLSRGQMMFQNDLPEAENERARHLYAGEVEYNADQIGRVLDWLDESGRADDTLVVLTADHGHHLGDHDYYYHHGELLYEAGVRIPLVMRLPGRLEPGAVAKEQVRSIDVMPTILELLGIDSPAMDGTSALSETPGPAFLETDISYFRENGRRYVDGVLGKVRAIRTSKYKLIYSPRPGDGVWELYDLEKDRDELTDLIADGSAPEPVVRRLTAELVRWLLPEERLALEALGNRFDGRTRPAARAPKPDDLVPRDGQQVLDATERDMLRSLGYVQ